MVRVNGLMKLAISDSDSLGPTKFLYECDGARADILRAVVVFLHATFEDVLRTIARPRITAAKADVLNEIPPAGTAKSQRKEKFALGSLDAHRGKTVDQLIDDSVQRYLSAKSINSCADVDKLLQQCGLDARPFRRLYPPLNQMMKRRHRIVHEGDLSGPTATASQAWGIADTYQLMIWLLAVPAFYSLLCLSFDPTDEVQRWNHRRLMRAIDGIADFARRLLDVPAAPRKLQLEAWMKANSSLKTVSAILKSKPRRLLRLALRKERRRRAAS